MHFSGYLIILANTLSLLALILYLLHFITIYFLSEAKFPIEYLVLLSFYPILVIFCTFYSWELHFKKRKILGVCLAYFPVIYAISYAIRNL